MGQLDRVRQARRDVRQAAAERWRDRELTREANKRQVTAHGIGAADSPQRNARYRARQAVFAEARELRRLGQLPIGIERRIGPTLDYTPFAPSDAARNAGRPVARLVDVAAPGLQPEGFATGFLIAPTLLITNHHVFPTAGDAVGTGANFLFERTERGLQAGITFELAPDAFYVSDARLDYAIVAVKPRSIDGRALDDFGIIALIEATPKILIGHGVNIIQYPEGGPKQYAVAQNRLVDILDEGFLQYETDTLQGSSGSPAFGEDWELVALHHTAIPELRDGRVVAIDGTPWDESMGDDRVSWVANEGIRVSAIVKHLGGVQLADPSRQALLRDLLASTTDPIDDLTRRIIGGDADVGRDAGDGAARNGGLGAVSPSPVLAELRPPGVDPAGRAAVTHNQFTFSGPVTIHVHAPDAASAVGALTPGELTPGALAPDPARRHEDRTDRAVAPEASIRFDPRYESRKGYDPTFLDRGARRIVVPTPGIAATRLGEMLLGRDSMPLVLKYHHFELVMNERRRLQMWSAVNVDYDPTLKSTRRREAFGADRWIPDPRIPARAQIFDADFYKPAGNIDRGHIVRREDNAWGTTELEMEFANSDTFHWTNCTPQHEAFNQSMPGRNDPVYLGMEGLWGAFENHIQQNLSGVDTKACILAGPVLDNTNDPTADFGLGPIAYPLRFWKVVAVTIRPPARTGTGRTGAPALRVFGFVLSQQPVVERFGIEAFEPGRFKRYQLSLATIEALTGLIFDPKLHAADTMRSGTASVRIERLDQLNGLGNGPASAASAEDPDV